MSRLVTRLGWTVGLALLLAACADSTQGRTDAATLTLDSISPERISARGGESLILRGGGFGPEVEVLLGDRSVPVIASTDASLVVEAPQMIAGTYDITVRHPGGEEALLSEALIVEPLELVYREVAANMLPAVEQQVQSAVSGDVDQDGDVDVILGAAAGPLRLLLNSGEGAFLDTSDATATEMLPRWDHDTRALVLRDLDGDGDLDLFVCNGSGEPNRLLENDGSGRFAVVEGLPLRVGSCLLAAADDLDEDGLPELVVVAGRELADATRILRVYRNRSDASGLRFELASELEPPMDGTGAPVGSRWISDPGQTSSFRLSQVDPAVGAGCGEAQYDFASVEGYALFNLDVPGVRFMPEELRLRIRGDGSEHLLSLRLIDSSGERFVQEVGPVVSTVWETVTVAQPEQWSHFGGNDDGVFDLPVTRVSLQVNRVAGGPEVGGLGVDEVALYNASVSEVLVEDFERRQPAWAWTGAQPSGLGVADLDGDGRRDVVLSMSQSSDDVFLRLLRGKSSSEGGAGTLGFSERPSSQPAAPVSCFALLDLEQDDDLDLLLLTATQDRGLINDGAAFFFDDTVSLLPVDLADGRHAAVADLNLDGYPDVVIANHGDADRLYLGHADGRLRDQSPRLGLARLPTRLVLLFDADGDGVKDVMTVSEGASPLRLLLAVADEPL